MSNSSTIPPDIAKQYVGLSHVAFNNDDLINRFPALPRLYAMVFLAWLIDVLIHMLSSSDL